MQNPDENTVAPGPVVYRRVALPVDAFDTMKALQRQWRTRTTAETLARLLLEHGETLIEDDKWRVNPDRLPGGLGDYRDRQRQGQTAAH